MASFVTVTSRLSTSYLGRGEGAALTEYGIVAVAAIAFEVVTTRNATFIHYR
jgi:hypothetical protein